MKRTVVYARRAEADLVSIYTYIAGKGNPDSAAIYTERIRTFCRSLGTFPERGTSWNHLAPNLRVVGLEHRVSIAFRISADRVTIVHILYGGRELKKILSGE